MCIAFPKNFVDYGQGIERVYPTLLLTSFVCKEWMTKYEELMLFEAKNNHTNVPAASALGEWVVQQKLQQMANTLAQNRIELLEVLGNSTVNAIHLLGLRWAHQRDVLIIDE